MGMERAGLAFILQKVQSREICQCPGGHGKKEIEFKKYILKFERAQQKKGNLVS